MCAVCMRLCLLAACLCAVSACLTNLVGSAMFACIGIVCQSTAVAVLVGVIVLLKLARDPH